MFTDSESSTLWQVNQDARILAFDLVTLEEKFTLSPPLSSKNIVHRHCHSFQRYKLSSYFAIGTIDARVFIWDLERGIISHTLQLTSPCYQCILDIKQGSIFLHMHSTQVYQFDLKTGHEIQSFKVGSKNIDKIALNPKVRLMAVAARYVPCIETIVVM